MTDAATSKSSVLLAAQVLVWETWPWHGWARQMLKSMILAWLATSAEINDPGMLGHSKCEET